MTRKQDSVPILVGVFLAVGVYTLKLARGRSSSIPQTEQPVPYPLPVTSCVKQVKVIKAELVNAGKSDESIIVQVENLSALGIVAISLEAT